MYFSPLVSALVLIGIIPYNTVALPMEAGRLLLTRSALVLDNPAQVGTAGAGAAQYRSPLSFSTDPDGFRPRWGHLTYGTRKIDPNAWKGTETSEQPRDDQATLPDWENKHPLSIKSSPPQGFDSTALTKRSPTRYSGDEWAMVPYEGGQQAETTQTSNAGAADSARQQQQKPSESNDRSSAGKGDANVAPDTAGPTQPRKATQDTAGLYGDYDEASKLRQKNSARVNQAGRSYSEGYDDYNVKAVPLGEDRSQTYHGKSKSSGRKSGSGSGTKTKPKPKTKKPAQAWSGRG